MNELSLPNEQIFYLQGKGSWSRVSKILTPVISAVAAIHSGNMHKHPYLSYQKYPDKSNSTIPELADALFRHLTAYVVTGKQDLQASHLDHLMCRTWMTVTIAYRHLLGHTVPTYVSLVDNSVYEEIRELDTNLWIDELSHVSLEPYLSIYKLWLSDRPVRPLPGWVYTDSSCAHTLMVVHSKLILIISTLLQKIVLSPNSLITPIGNVLTDEQPVDTILHYMVLLYYSHYTYWLHTGENIDHLTGPYTKESQNAD